MGHPPVDKTLAYVSELFQTLIVPIILFLLAGALIIYDGIIDPPTEMNGMSGLALVLIALATGRGIDIRSKSKDGVS